MSDTCSSSAKSKFVCQMALQGKDLELGASLLGCRMENVLNSLPIAMYVKNKRLEYTWGNAGFAEMCQSAGAEVGGRSAFDLFSEDQANLAHEHDLHVLQTGETRAFETEAQIAGQTRRAHIIKMPVLTPKKEIVGVMSIAFDQSHSTALSQELIKGLNTLKQQNEMLMLKTVDLEASLRFSEKNAASVAEAAETVALKTDELQDRALDLETSLAYTEEQASNLAAIAENKAIESDELRERALDLESSLAYTEEQANTMAELAEQLEEQRRQIAEHNAQIERLMYRDDITGAHSRRYFFDKMPDMLKARAHLENKGVLAILDIDFFKSINDKYGHLVGDDALRAFVEVVSKHLPDDTVFCRLGGEEFTILTPSVGMGQVRDFLEVVRTAVASHRIGCMTSVFRVTVSIGAVSLDEADDLLTLLNKADKALYKAKDAGRNQVVYFDETM